MEFPEMTPEAQLGSPDRFDTTPVIGWRVWELPHTWENIGDGTAELLRSPVSRNLWEPGFPNEADCRRDNTRKHDREACPDLACTCGIYAMRLRQDCRVGLSSNRYLVVFGQVSLWGRVIEHRYGWRGQYAYPYSLSIIRSLGRSGDAIGLKRVAERLTATYGVEARIH